MGQLETTYDHKLYEKKWWDFWNAGGWFHAEVDENKEPFTILIPPPNVTNRLHMGHGLNSTLQDILIRWKRMLGFNCCWLPGTDHAGIATQMMVEKALLKEGKTRQELGRDEFFSRCVEWKNEHGGVIIEQLKRLGASCDWKREAYTMDESLSFAVRKIFVDLYEKGLIYRGERLVNWDPEIKTAISDDEVISEERPGNLWSLQYKLADDESQFLTVATSRPETMFGDSAIAVHPDDSRYQDLIGRYAIVPFVNRRIPIVADDYVKAEFGSGCVKITPAHDPNDFALGKRHQLEMINIFNIDASLNDVCPPPFRGLDRYAARKLVIKELKELGQFAEVTATKHAVPISDRSKAVIEPRLSKQWYVKMSHLAEPAINAAESGELKFYPQAWSKTYLHWLNHIQDWCISRQLWWGHRIPIWYCDACDSATTGLKDPKECSHCGSENLEQDEDVLDTWFSSWLWPLSPFGWPGEDSKAVDYFFPSNVLVTAPDIIYLWVARMVMAGYFLKNELAFSQVYFNATICDKDGRKFSKTLGNGIDPLEMIDQHGADAVRYTCVSLAPLGGRVKLAKSDFDIGNRFINKIWNAARFLLGKIGDQEEVCDFRDSDLDLPSKWLVNELHISSHAIANNLENYQINEAVETMFHLAWRSFCDWGLEVAKSDLDDKPSQNRDRVISALVFVFEGILRLAAPVIPFVAEEIWHQMPQHPRWKRPKSLVVAQYPLAKQLPSFVVEAEMWLKVQSIVEQIRSLRAQAKISPKVKMRVLVQCDGMMANVLRQSETWLKNLAGVSDLSVGDNLSRPESCLVGAGKGWVVYLPAEGYVDFEKEKERIEAEIKRIKGILAGLSAKLANKNFVDKAPKAVVDATKAQYINMQNQEKSLVESLAAMP